ncbi:hypothetical protein OCQ_11430 [Mycobacterium paraintracellulare]|nr:hypothetical protein OCQ_11430 [Mycobacterium paraintracellulare]
MEDFRVRQQRKLAQMGQQSQYVVALLDHTECQLLDHHLVATDFVVGQAADEAMLGDVQMVNPYRCVNEDHGSAASAAGRPTPWGPCRRAPRDGGRSLPE